MLRNSVKVWAQISDSQYFIYCLTPQFILHNIIILALTQSLTLCVGEKFYLKIRSDKSSSKCLNDKIVLSNNENTQLCNKCGSEMHLYTRIERGEEKGEF